MSVRSFTAKIAKIGVNPYVPVPASILKTILLEAGKTKGPIPIKGQLNGYPFIQTLVRYSGKWRLYLNTPMRRNAGIDVGDLAKLKIEYDPKPRSEPMHPKLKKALKQNKEALLIFKNLPPHYQKEITRYLNSLKTEESVDRNINKAMLHLLGKERFVGREAFRGSKQNR